jgi:hypothetical protein
MCGGHAIFPVAVAWVKPWLARCRDAASSEIVMAVPGHFVPGIVTAIRVLFATIAGVDGRNKLALGLDPRVRP